MGTDWDRYEVSIFAPNHKAMPVLDRSSQLDFLRRRVLTSRNVIAHPITDFWYGGLNYQIEHHLFPRLPRNKLREVQAIVKDFCRDHASLITRPACSSPTEKSCNTCMRSERRSAKQEKRGEIPARSLCGG